jgi:hypothetical protein
MASIQPRKMKRRQISTLLSNLIMRDEYPLETKTNLHYIYAINPYRAVKTLSLGYNDQSIKAV